MKKLTAVSSLIAILAVLPIRSFCVPAEPVVCKRASSVITIDGKLDDAAWKDCDVISFVVPVSHKKPISKTEVRMLWDDKYLYVSYRAYDKDIWSIFTQRDSVTCSEDCLELFLQPDRARQIYYNFETNALGTVYDAYDIGKNSGGYDHHRWAQWNCQGLRVAISIQGTLNNWQDTDRSWQMEVAVPFAELPSLGGATPKVGDVWRVLLARYDYSVYLSDGVELSSCAPLNICDFHNTIEWLPLKFEY